MKRSYRSEWYKKVADRLDIDDGYKGSVAYVEGKGGVFANWELLSMPESAGLSYLDSAAKIACGAWGHPYQHLFLGWANLVSDRALADPRFEIEATNSRDSWRTPGVYPGNHGETLAVAAIARAMRDDDAPDHDMLVQAAEEITQTSIESKGSEWDEFAQGGYLRAIQLLLIAGEVNQAKAMFKIRRGFKYVKNLAEWLKTFTLALPDHAATHVADENLTAHFDQQFDMLRDPAYKLPSGRDETGVQLGQSLMPIRLELALIKQRYVLGLPYRGQWQHIIGLISA